MSSQQPTNLEAQHEELLLTSLTQIFGDFDPSFLKRVTPALAWIELAGGETLMRQGEPGDDVFFVISGRLGAYMSAEDGSQHFLGEVIRGETVGELSFFTREPRSATVIALRDSSLVRISRPVFRKLLRVYPEAASNVTRLLIARLKRSNMRRPIVKRLANICLLPITAGVDAEQFGQRFTKKLEQHGKTLLLTSRVVDRAMEESIISHATKHASDAYRRLSRWLEETELGVDFLVLVADGRPDSEWTRRCIRHADKILLLANADDEPAIHATEAALLTGPGKLTSAKQQLVLLHDEAKRLPTATSAWLDRRPVDAHVHIRPTLDRDLARLARLESGNGVGLVLSGGGARGFAHLGIYRALVEQGIEVDVVGGTSMGAVMGVYVGLDMMPQTILEKAKQAFRQSPTSDVNLLPFFSLIKGRRLRKIIDQALLDCAGCSPAIEDCWKTYFCVAANYSRPAEVIMRRGDIGTSLRASVSIPGVFPPVIHRGDLLVDGGVFNNFPVDVMAAMGLGKIIGCEMKQPVTHHSALPEVPSTLEILRDRLRRPQNRRYQLPTLVDILFNATMLYSSYREVEYRKLTDLYFSPNLSEIGAMHWGKFDDAVHIGYQHARSVLAKLPAGELSTYRS